MRWLWNIPMWCHGSDQNASDVGAFHMVGFLIRDAESVKSLMKSHLPLNRGMKFSIGNLVEVKDSRCVISPVIRYLRW
jgi:hypothetical protein